MTNAEKPFGFSVLVEHTHLPAPASKAWDLGYNALRCKTLSKNCIFPNDLCFPSQPGRQMPESQGGQNRTRPRVKRLSPGILQFFRSRKAHLHPPERFKQTNLHKFSLFKMTSNAKEMVVSWFRDGTHLTSHMMWRLTWQSDVIFKIFKCLNMKRAHSAGL